MHCLSFLLNKCLITFTLVKRIGIAYFFSVDISSDSLKVFGFLVKLFHVISKKASFQVFGYNICSVFVKLMQHIWFGVYQIYTQHIYWVNLLQKLKFVSISWNSKYAEFNRGDQFFCFRLEIHFFGQIWSKRSKLSVLLKFGT